jgi:cytochrome-b5 reductase
MVELISGAKAKDKSQGEIGGILKELGYTSENVFKF